MPGELLVEYKSVPERRAADDTKKGGKDKQKRVAKRRDGESSISPR